MKKASKERRGHAGQGPGATRFPPLQVAAAGVVGAIVLIVVMIVISVMGHM